MQSGYKQDDRGIFRSGRTGYWSNLNKAEGQRLAHLLESTSAHEAVMRTFPQHEQIIFSPKREAALELLNIQPGEVCMDFGCMWGSLSMGMAKRGGTVLSFDQTYDSLLVLERRRRDEGLSTPIVLQDDIRAVKLPGLADCALINGVLEWIPESGEIELKEFYAQKTRRHAPAKNPGVMQLEFLRQVRDNLKEGGRLLLAIENRYDMLHFLGKRDPHSGLLLTAILPRAAADFVSRMLLDRPYVNWIYSFPALKDLLARAGYSRVELYMAFPDYHYPELILPYDAPLEGYRPYPPTGPSWKRKAASFLERFAMQRLKARFFAPAIMALAHK